MRDKCCQRIRQIAGRGTSVPSDMHSLVNLLHLFLILCFAFIIFLPEDPGMFFIPAGHNKPAHHCPSKCSWYQAASYPGSSNPQ